MTNPVNHRAMPMSLREYCAWYYNLTALENIFGLSTVLVLPKSQDIMQHAHKVEGYQIDDLIYVAYCLEPETAEYNTYFDSVVEQLRVDTSFPNIRQSAKTVCRWIISQENLITKNLDPRKRETLISDWQDYVSPDSPFAPLVKPFIYARADEGDFAKMSTEEKLYVLYFNKILEENRNDFPKGVGALEDRLKQLEIPKEYDEIFMIMFNYYADNYSINDWINAEARIVDLAKQVYKILPQE